MPDVVIQSNVFFRWSTNKSVVSRQNIFHLISVRILFINTLQCNILGSAMVLTCEAISSKWTEQNNLLHFKFKLLLSLLFLPLLWETHQPRHTNQEESETSNV